MDNNRAPSYNKLCPPICFNYLQAHKFKSSFLITTEFLNKDEYSIHNLGINIMYPMEFVREEIPRGLIVELQHPEECLVIVLH